MLDRYHITANVNKAVDKVRAEEARALDRKGTPVTSRSASPSAFAPRRVIGCARPLTATAVNTPCSVGSEPDRLSNTTKWAIFAGSLCLFAKCRAPGRRHW